MKIGGIFNEKRDITIPYLVEYSEENSSKIVKENAVNNIINGQKLTPEEWSHSCVQEHTSTFITTHVERDHFMSESKTKSRKWERIFIGVVTFGLSELFYTEFKRKEYLVNIYAICESKSVLGAVIKHEPILIRSFTEYTEWEANSSVTIDMNVSEEGIQEIKDSIKEDGSNPEVYGIESEVNSSDLINIALKLRDDIASILETEKESNVDKLFTSEDMIFSVDVHPQDEFIESKLIEEDEIIYEDYLVRWPDNWLASSTRYNEYKIKGLSIHQILSLDNLLDSKGVQTNNYGASFKFVTWREIRTVLGVDESNPVVIPERFGDNDRLMIPLR